MKILTTNNSLLSVFTLLILSVACTQIDKKEVELQGNMPNIIIIYADDLGYGDVSSYGATELQTPNFDRIANEGIKFTNGYATSATCTPSRYALLSGEYPWRNENAFILPGNAPLLFDTAKQTLPSMLKEAGYKTAVIGKWHLGLGNEGLDWNGEIAPGPNEIGFDYSYILASTNDRAPTVYVKNHKVVGLNLDDPLKVSYQKNFPGEPTGKDNPELLKLHPSHGHINSIHNGISRNGYMRGGKSALFIDEDMADTILLQTKEFITSNKDNPFFLFYSLHQPHVPRTPHPRFVGSSGMGARGDAILEADWCVGQVLNTLDSLGIAENTIIVFSSDNGPVLDDGYKDDSYERVGNHTPFGPLRGGKYSLFDAGTHVPFMIRWPNAIKPRVSDALVCQLDLLASFATLTGQENKSKDSQDILAALKGESAKGRDNLIVEAMSKLAIRKGNWIMIPPYKGNPIINQWVRNETGNSEEYQLYNLTEDIGQQNNLAKKLPDIVKEMEEEMNAIKK